MIEHQLPMLNTWPRLLPPAPQASDNTRTSRIAHRKSHPIRNSPEVSKTRSKLISNSAFPVVLLVLFLVGLAPLIGYSHEVTPVLPEEQAEQTTEEHVRTDGASNSSETATGKQDAGHETGTSDVGGEMQQDAGEGPVARSGMSGHGIGQHGDAGMTMIHPGLPLGWILAIAFAAIVIFGWTIGVEAPKNTEIKTRNLAELPIIGHAAVFLNSSPVPLFILKVITVTAFMLVVIAGFFGTVYPERNLATVLVWNWWWPLVIVSVFFVGSAWCAICPWDTLSSWIVRRKLWRRAFPHPGRNRSVPKHLRHVWLALALFLGLTWLELGVGVTSIPSATAMMALVMLGLSLVFLILYERKAFCRYGCPVGRTLGFYARLAPIALRPKDQDVCANCNTLECYRGSEAVEPCPTSLTIGKFSQNTYCLSCGNCVLSCPKENVSWRLRTMGSEAMSDARQTWDGAWFMLVLLGITMFHGVTMLEVWTDLVIGIARFIGETGRVIWSFSLAMIGGFGIPIVIYAIAIGFTMYATGSRIGYKQLFVALPFSTLPLAFTYHLAHNLNHLFREGGGILGLFFNPLGGDAKPLSMMERHAQMTGRISEELLFTMETGLMIMGVWLAVHILRHRAAKLLPNGESIRGLQLAPMLLFILIASGANVWLLSQDMVMRF